MKLIKLYFLIVIFYFLLIIGCKCQKTSNNMSFNFPSDLTSLVSKRKIDDSSVNKWQGILKLEYDDNNYSLLNNESKNKILIDKKQNLILCFKSNEVNNFKIIYNEKDKFTYGIYEIFYLDSNLMPLLSFGQFGSFIYTQDNDKRKTIYTKIKFENDLPLNQLSYKLILEIIKKFKNNEFKIIDNKKESNFFINPFLWEM